MIVYCIRHGESAFNAEGRIQGQLDVPLSEIGLRQSEALAANFRDHGDNYGIQAVFASPLKRAYETAVPIAEALGLPIQTDDRFKELNAGIFQGLTWDELAAKYPSEAEQWKTHEPDFRIPDGETRRELMQRGAAGIMALEDTGLQSVLLVAHGGMLSAAFKGLLQIPAELNPFALFNASISSLSLGQQVKLLTLNQIDHLMRFDPTLYSRPGDL